MAIESPNKGTALHNHQCVFFKTDWDILSAGIAGIDCVLSGLAMTGGADMTPDVAKGAVLTNRVLKAVAAASVTITAADTTNPRFDYVVVTSSGALAVRAGTPAANPVPPALTANDVVIYQVYIPAGATQIAQGNLKDRRVTPQFPITIYRTTGPETTNTTAAAIEILNKVNSGVVIPNGLLTTGRALRVRIWGNLLMNSGTPTLTLAILFGGVTMFSDVSAAALASAVRRAFFFEFVVNSQANADQALGLLAAVNDWAAAIAAPGTGIGDVWPGAGTSEPSQVGSGAGTADADAADRTLNVRFTFSVSNVLDEIVVEGASVDLT